MDVRTAFDTIGDRNASVVFFHNFFHHGQTQACAVGFVGDIRFKGIGQHFFAEACAVVLHVQVQAAFCRIRVNPNVRCRIALRCFGGIFEQVVQHLAHGGGVGIEHQRHRA